MANNEEFKQKAKETIDTIVDVSVETYKVAEERARLLAKKTKLRASIVNEKATIRRLSVELGTAYYNKKKDNPPEEFAKMFAEITAAHEKIAEKEKEIEDIKAAAKE